MILPDVNVLVYAFRADAERHARCRRWLEDVVGGPSAYGVSPQVLAAVVRACTHRRIYERPSELASVLAFCRELATQPNAAPVVPGTRHWAIFEQICGEANATGNLVQDAWYAALAIESGCEWISFDRDYARFPGLRWREPD